MGTVPQANGTGKDLPEKMADSGKVLLSVCYRR
jgi:hypothetical protein